MHRPGDANLDHLLRDKDGYDLDNDRTSSMVLVESYNNEPVHEYDFRRVDRHREGQQQDSLQYLGKRSMRRRVHSLRAFFAEVFLPQGYPATVSADYLDYQLYDTLQAFASSLNGALATLAVLKGVGVGNEQATVLAAALTWLLKDGIGMVARIVFAWAKGTRLDSDCKQWRLFADVLNDASFFIDLVNPYCGPAFFTPLACTASLLRSMVGVAGGATRMSIIRHQARRDNLADVAAKDGSQETLVNVLSLLVSLALLPMVDGHPWLIWSLFMVFTAIHLFANYCAVKSTQLETLNQHRFRLAVGHFLLHGQAPTVQWCNQREPLLLLGIDHHQLSLGCSLDVLLDKLGGDHHHILAMQNADDEPVEEDDGQFAWKYCSNETLCLARKTGLGRGWLAISEDASEAEVFDAVFALEHYASRRKWPSASMTQAFRQQMRDQGWSLQVNQLNMDEWRFRRGDNGQKKAQ